MFAGNKSKFLLALGALLILALGLTACSMIDSVSNQSEATPTAASTAEDVQGVIAEGHIEPRESRSLGFVQPGTVAEVLVQKGDQVEKDQVLARLSETEDLDARLQAAHVEELAAQVALDDLQRTADLTHAEADTTLQAANQAVVEAGRVWDEVDTQDYEDDIEDARTEVADAEKELNDAQADFEPYADLPEDNSQRETAQAKVDDAQDTYNTARRKLDELVINYEMARANLAKAEAAQAEALHRFNQTLEGPDPDQLKLAQDRLQAVQTQIQAIETAYDGLLIKAPFAGEVMDVKILQGERVAMGSPAFVLADLSEWYVRTSDLTELEVVKIANGQTVSISPDAMPELQLSGVVAEISQVFRNQSGDIVYDVRIRLDEIDPLLRWGMTVEVDFEGD